MKQCYHTNFVWNIYDDPSKPIAWHPIGHCCKELHCFNGHSFIVLGCIPELEAPTYATLRNRVCADGSEWLKPEMKAFMSTKLKDSNTQYTSAQQKRIDRQNKWQAFKNMFRKA